MKVITIPNIWLTEDEKNQYETEFYTMKAIVHPNII